MAETHINAFKEDVTVALGEVRDALTQAEAKLAAFVAKVDTELDPSPVTPIAPAEPVTQPAAEK